MSRYRDLRAELEAIASVELADELEAWDAWTPAQLQRLARYLRDELGPHGLLSVEHGREAGIPLRQARRQAAAILRRAEHELAHQEQELGKSGRRYLETRGGPVNHWPLEELQREAASLRRRQDQDGRIYDISGELTRGDARRLEELVRAELERRQGTQLKLPTDPEYAELEPDGQLALGVPGEQRAIPGLAKPGRPAPLTPPKQEATP